MPDPIAVRFATALAGKDSAALRKVLAPDVDFKGLTPRRFWEATDVDEVLDVLFGNWFEKQDRIDGLIEMSTDHPVEDTAHFSYRFAVSTPDGPHVVEQQAYYRAVDGQISWLRVLCSGFRRTGG
jgi:hypothetical protein